MNLNPITALSDQLQKLINEHGSAAILRDHLALFKDQLAILEKRVVDLENDKTALIAQIQRLELEKQYLQLNNDNLTQKVQNLESNWNPNIL